jgi:hypothetical protein
MKAKTLSLCAGIGGVMLLAEAAPAGFTGIEWEQKANDFGVFTVNVYATFDNSNDALYAVAGTPNAPLQVEVVAGSFYQNSFGSDLSPNPALLIPFPSLAYDTFVTIGKKTSTGDQTGLTPNWPGFGTSLLPDDPVDGENMAWFITPDQSQGAPVDGRVLMGQFSSMDSEEIKGQFLISAVSDGDGSFQEYVSFTTLVPAPGALALLGLACVGGRRRRK